MKKNKFVVKVGFLTSLVLPSTVVVACGSANQIYKSALTTTLLESADEIVINEETSYEEIKEQAYFYVYENEQAGSIQLQEDYFAWEFYELVEELEDYEDDSEIVAEILGKYRSGTKEAMEILEDEDDEDDNDSDALKILKEEWNDLVEVSSNLDNYLDNNDEEFYDEDDFATNYPYILEPLDVVYERQEKIYDDQKEAFITQGYSDRAEGENDWINSLYDNYGGAVDDEEAIEYMVLQEIKPVLDSRYTYEINDDFTCEQYKWAEEENFEHFAFLEGATIKDGSTIDEYVYFVGNGSSDPAQKNVLPEMEDGEELVSFRHFLIAAYQDPNGSELPWIIDAETAKNLFNFESFESVGNQAYEYIPSVFADFDGSSGYEVNPTDEDFLAYYSNNSDSTKYIGGSLGAEKPSEFVAGMVPGFQLGVMKYMQDDKDENLVANLSSDNILDPSSNNILDELVYMLGIAYDLILEKAGWEEDVDKPIENQEDLDDWLTEVTNDEIVQIVGKAIRDVFDKPGSENGIDQFYYPLSENRFVVISSNGIHIVTYTESFLTNDAINDSLERVAEEQSVEYDEYSVVDSINSYYSEYRIMSEIFQDEVFQKWINEDKIELVDDQTFEEIYEEAVIFAKTKIENAYINSVNAIASSFDWLVDQYDQELREMNATSYAPEDLYEAAIAFARGGSA